MDCDLCNGPIEGARGDARYCSDACRQRAYRERKRVLDRYGSWEAALTAITEEAPWSVTDNDRPSRNGGRDDG